MYNVEKFLLKFWKLFGKIFEVKILHILYLEFFFLPLP